MTYMYTSRRSFLASAAAFAALGAQAQGASSAPIRMVVPFAAGGATDVLGRDLAKAMGATLGQPFVVENAGGGAGVPAVQKVTGAKADGGTLLFAASGNITAQPLLQKPRVDILTQLTPVGMIATAPHVLVVAAKMPFKTLAELVAYAKAHPGQLNFGSAGVGGLAHLGTALFARAAQVDIKHVPYRGAAAAMTDLISGQIHAMFGTMPSFTGMVQNGSLRVVGITAPSAAAPLKGIPLISNTVRGFGYKSWNAIFTPVGTPAPIIARLYAAMKQATVDPGVARRFEEQGVDIELADAAELTDMIRKETALWDKVIREANIHVN
ncbi:MAG: tripartite tricarboxylate transporter substrate binding protein [Polaromonas sp.]|uniref:Bug family tripartite tricarboxylate transporter substrate binding protein n=1 Tax=Polaromonas sp. TaxID=1869339 RepID=UPI003262E257